MIRKCVSRNWGRGGERAHMFDQMVSNEQPKREGGREGEREREREIGRQHGREGGACAHF
jgi:hypothetical protein